MKNKEINLSSSSLDQENELENSILENLKEEDKKDDAKEKNKKKQGKMQRLKAFFKKFPVWWSKAPVYKKALVVGIPALIILAGSLFFVYQVIYGPRTQPPQLIAINEPFLAPKGTGDDFVFANLRLPSPSVPRTEESPINGRLFTKEEMEELKERRPVAVIINNHPESRPTSNLSQADMIFETRVEGGATRMLAIYWSREPEKVGTIRSARQYFLEWLSPFDPLFIYDGYAASSNPRVNAGGNISAYNIKSIATTGAWRVGDRRAPHNEYSSPVRAWEEAEKRGWTGFPDVTSWEFKKDKGIEDRGDRFRATMNFSNDPQYAVTWEYDQSTNRYLRSIGNQPDIDLETAQQLSAKNVIIQEVEVTGPVDQYNRLIIDTVGSGDAIILRDGKITNGTWRKDSRIDRTKYYDSNGDEIEFNRGLTWVLASSQIQSRFDIIEQ